MKTFQLYGKTICFTDSMEKYNLYRNLYLSYASDAEQLYAEKYDEFGNLENFVNQGREVAIELVDSYLEKVKSHFISTYKIYDFDFNELKEQYYSSGLFLFDDFYDGIVEKYYQITDNQAELDAYRTQRRKNRDKLTTISSSSISNYVSSEFKAGAYNLATGVAHGVFNSISAGLSHIKDSMSMSSIYSDDENIETLLDSIYNSVFNIHYLALDFEIKYNLITEDEIKSVPNLNKDIIKKASSFKQNLSSIPVDDLKEIAPEILSTDPYYFDLYALLFEKFGDKGGELQQLAKFVALDDQLLEKKGELIVGKLEELDLSSEDNAKESKVKLKDIAFEFGLKDTEFENLEKRVDTVISLYQEGNHPFSKEALKTRISNLASKKNIQDNSNFQIVPNIDQNDLRRAIKSYGYKLTTDVNNVIALYDNTVLRVGDRKATKGFLLTTEGMVLKDDGDILIFDYSSLISAELKGVFSNLYIDEKEVLIYSVEKAKAKEITEFLTIVGRMASYSSYYLVNMDETTLPEDREFLKLDYNETEAQYNVTEEESNSTWDDSIPQTPQNNDYIDNQYSGNNFNPSQDISFLDKYVITMKSCLSKTLTFKGRASRFEFWCFFGTSFLIMMLLTMIVGMSQNEVFAGILGGYVLLLTIPSLSCTIRRFHDFNMSAKWPIFFYISFAIPIVGLFSIIAFFVITLKKGTEGRNDFGEDPCNVPLTSSGFSGLSPDNSKKK